MPTDVPRCARCRHLHLVDLPCWKGSYRDQLTAVVLDHSRACHMCGGWATEVDHFIPRSQGGTDDRDNLLPACRRHNAAKGAGAPLYPAAAPVRPTGVGLSERWRP